MNDPLQRVAQLLTGAGKVGESTRDPQSTPQVRYGKVTGTAGGQLLVALGGDTVSSPMPALAHVEAATGDTVQVQFVSDSPSVVGVVGSSAAVGVPAFLGREDDAAGGGSAPDSTYIVLNLGVTIPAGLPAGTQVKIEGDVFVSSASGIASRIGMSGMSSPPPGRVINQSATYDGHVVGYDGAGAGSRTYSLTVASATAGQSVTWRAPSLRAELLFPG